MQHNFILLSLRSSTIFKFHGATSILTGYTKDWKTSFASSQFHHFLTSKYLDVTRNNLSSIDALSYKNSWTMCVDIQFCHVVPSGSISFPVQTRNAGKVGNARRKKMNCSVSTVSMPFNVLQLLWMSLKQKCRLTHFLGMFFCPSRGFQEPHANIKITTKQCS